MSNLKDGVFCYRSAINVKLKSMFYLDELKTSDINNSSEQSMVAFLSIWVDK
jgi:hypothetical protein